MSHPRPKPMQHRPALGRPPQIRLRWLRPVLCPRHRRPNLPLLRQRPRPLRLGRLSPCGLLPHPRRPCAQRPNTWTFLTLRCGAWLNSPVPRGYTWSSIVVSGLWAAASGIGLNSAPALAAPLYALQGLRGRMRERGVRDPTAFIAWLRRRRHTDGTLPFRYFGAAAQEDAIAIFDPQQVLQLATLRLVAEHRSTRAVGGSAGDGRAVSTSYARHGSGWSLPRSPGGRIAGRCVGGHGLDEQAGAAVSGEWRLPFGVSWAGGRGPLLACGS